MDNDVFVWYDKEKTKGRSHVFLDIGETRLTISELVSVQKNKVRVKGVSSIKYAGHGEWEDALSRLWGLFLESRGHKPKSVFVTIPSDLLHYQVEVFPKMPESDLKIAINNNIHLLLESKLNEADTLSGDIRLGSVVVKPVTRYNILLYAGIREKIQEYTSSVEKCGVQVSGVATPQLIYICFFNHPDQGNSFAFAEIDDRYLRLDLFIDGVLSSIHSLALTAGSNSLDNIVVQLRQALLYYSQNFPQAQIGRLVFYDNGSKDIAWDRLRQIISIETDVLTAEDLAQFPSSLRKEMADRPIPLLSPLQMKIPSKKLPLVQQKKPSLVSPRTWGIAFWLLWFFIVSLGYLYVYQKLSTYRLKISQLSMPTPEQVKELETSYQSMMKQDRRYRVVEKLMKSKYQWLHFLEHVLNARPEGVAFTALDFSEENRVFIMTVEGKIDLPYGNAIEAHEKFKSSLAPYFSVVFENLQPYAKPIVFSIKFQGREGVE